MTAVLNINDGVMRAADGTPLKRKLQQSMRAEQIKALVLIAPLFIFILFSFLVPIGQMLTNAFWDPAVHNTLPTTVQAMKSWDGKSLPEEAVFAAFAADMKVAQKAKQAALVGKRLNYEIPT
jgi:putative spermidine/putrescine transport system permease protein